MRYWRLGGPAAVAAIIIGVFLAGPAHAGDTHWIHDPSTPGDWFDPSNWDPSAPGVMDAAFFDDGGTAVIAGGSVTVATLMTGIGGAIPGSVIQSGGTTTVMYAVHLGFAAGDTGTYDLSGGSLTSHDEYVGYLGTGGFAQSGGTHVVRSTLELGYTPGAMGTYDLSAGSLGADFEHVGPEGIGTFTQSGGTNSAGNLNLGALPGATGTYGLTGGSLGAGTLSVGGAGTGSFIQTGGTNLVDWTLYLGITTAGTGSYELAGGSLSSHRLFVGSHGTAGFTQTGGINTNTLGGSLVLGEYDGSFGTYALSGGSLRSTKELVGGFGTGVFNQSGGTNVVTDWVELGRGYAALGMYHLSGGSLQTPSLVMGDIGQGTFIQTGGTAVVASQLWMENSALYDLSGGSLFCNSLVLGAEATGSTFVQSGGTSVIPNGITIGMYLGSFGTLRHSGGLLDARGGSIQAGSSGMGNFQTTGGTVLADEISATHGTVTIGRNAAVTVGGLRLTDSASAETTLIFELRRARSAFISGLGDPSSTATIGPEGTHTLDLQTGSWRPLEGQTFYVLKHFGSITGSFDDITTNITGGQQMDPNALLPVPLPFFAAYILSSPNDPGRLAVVFQGLTAGDANGDHAVDGGDLGLMGSNWWQTGMGWGDCDFNGDGYVDGGDIALLGGNWMWTLPPAPGVALPEPATLIVLGLGAGAVIRRRR